MTVVLFVLVIAAIVLMTAVWKIHPLPVLLPLFISDPFHSRPQILCERI